MHAYGLPSDAHQRYSEDGVVFLHKVLDKSAMRKVEAAYERTVWPAVLSWMLQLVIVATAPPPT